MTLTTGSASPSSRLSLHLSRVVHPADRGLKTKNPSHSQKSRRRQRNAKTLDASFRHQLPVHRGRCSEAGASRRRSRLCAVKPATVRGPGNGSNGWPQTTGESEERAPRDRRPYAVDGTIVSAGALHHFVFTHHEDAGPGRRAAPHAC